MDDSRDAPDRAGRFSAVRPADADATDAAAYDWSAEPSLTLALVDAVTATLDVGVDEIAELNSAVDADALEDLFEDGRSPERVRFEFHGCDVTLTSSHITVSPP
jgi:hypothetical protein